MPTKPAFGAYIWATDALYTTGPAPLIGTATKITPPLANSDEGWNADEAPPAQWENFSANLLTNWTDWVRLGSNTADEDAHILESDALGKFNAVRGEVGGHSVGAVPSLELTQPVPDIAGSFALRVIATHPNAPGVFLTHSGANNALLVNTSGSVPAARFEGNTNAQGAEFGQNADLATNAVGLNLEPRATIPDPGISTDGDLWMSSDHDSLQFIIGGGTSVVHAGSGALIHRAAQDLTESSTTAAGTPITKTSVTFGVPENLRTGRRVYIRASCEVGQNNTVLGACNIGLRDVTAAVDIEAPRVVRTFQSTSDASEKYVTIQADYTIPADGAREIALTFISDGVGGNTMFIRNAMIEVEGQYVL